MAMDRRQFLGAAAAPLVLVPSVLPAGPVPLGGEPWPDAKPSARIQNGPITVLSRQPENAGERLMMALSENVFVRLTAHCEHAVRLDDQVDKLGSVTSRKVSMDLQMNCHSQLPTSLAGDHPPEFFHEDFVAKTEHWTTGQMMELHDYYNLEQDKFKHFDPEEKPPNVAELLKGKTACGMLPLPHGCLWVGNYICSQTGLAMRAIGTYHMDTDAYVLRWDVLLG